MEDIKKWLAFVYLIFAMISWYLSTALIKWLANYFMLIERYAWANILIYGLPIIIGVATYALCYKLDKIHVYMTDVVGEVKKVVWPQKKETWGATIVVLIAVAISAVFMGTFDWLSAMLMQYILK